MKQLILAVPILLVALASGAGAKTSNGNDFALFLSEAKTTAERKDLIENAVGRPHYFRYLKIMALEEGETNGRPYVAVVALEPGSCMEVTFTVTKSVSLAKLEEDPASSVADAIAVTGRIVSADPDKNRIELDPVIVRHKDCLTPKIGKELLYELDPNAICYSFTAGKQAVQVPYKHRDLLTFKTKILDQQGKQAWTDFLQEELAKRAQAAEK